MSKGLVEQFPFILPGHGIMEQSAFDAVNAELWEIVGTTIAGRTIRRIPRIQIPVPVAVRPPPAEEVQLGRTITKEALNADPRTSAQLAETAYEALTALAMRARNGDGKALWQFATVTIRATTSLSQMTKAKPAALRPLARKLSRWPLLMSHLPANCEPKYRLREIQLGCDSPIHLHKSGKTKADLAATYAVRLIEHVQDLWMRKAFRDELPALSAESVSTWWDVAQAFLLASYPEPQNVKELEQLISAKTKRTTPGRLKQAILDKIQARFSALV